jgi:hypothetical protein
MNKLIFCPPKGEIIHNPDRELLRQIILKDDAEYWLNGSKDAGLHFESGEKKSQLILRFRKGLGYCVYYEADINDLPLVLNSNSPDREIIELKESGNILKLPKSYFVQASVAWEAVDEFMRSGKPTSNGQWIVFSPKE